MRLLKRNNPCSDSVPSINDFSLVDFEPPGVPYYAILSHRWGMGEVTFQDIQTATVQARVEGLRKLAFCAEQAAHDGLIYFWVDTCCINKSDLSELTKAINSMFRWYQNAAKCYVYLSDVSNNQDPEVALQHSQWFRRGWTLQELIAPRIVEFFSQEGRKLGDKTSLEKEVHSITGIPIEVLRGTPLSEIETQERFKWTEGRSTTVEEDEVYCLLGIFDISMPLIPGEGRQRAFSRLHIEIEHASDASMGDFLTRWRVSHGMLVDVKDSVTGNTALIQASYQGDLAGVRQLIETRADINAVNNRGSTALAEACQKGYPEIIRRLLLAGADCNAIDKSGCSVLAQCILVDQHEALQLLLKHGVLDLESTNTKSRQKPLMEAILRHNWSIVKMLLEYGAAPNFGPRSPLRAVVQACEDETTLLELIELLIQKGADVNCVDEEEGGSWSAVKEAVEHRRFAPLKLLISHGAALRGLIDGYPLICKLVLDGADVKWVRLLVSQKVDIEAHNHDGWVALREAIVYTRVEHVKYLLEARANPNDRLHHVNCGDHTDLSLLLHAVWGCQHNRPVAYDAVILMLIRSGARLEDQDSYGWTALRMAVELGCEAIACLLVHCGANPHAETPDRITVYNAARNKNMRKLLTLIDDSIKV